MRIKFVPRQRLVMAIERVTIIVIFASGTCAGARYCIVLASGGPAPAHPALSPLPVALFTMLFALWMVFVATCWVRYPVFLCREMVLTKERVRLFARSDRPLIDVRYWKAELTASGGKPAGIWFTVEGAKNRTFDVPSQLIPKERLAELYDYLGASSP